jgi:hypothetical protein
VTIGLDARGYNRGMGQFERDQKKSRDTAKKGANELGDSLAELGKKAAILFTAFTAAKDFASWMTGLNVGAANLGRFSKNIGESVTTVNAWGNAAELAGGSAKDAQADLMGLSGSITGLRATGEVSPLVLLLQRMNVQLFDAQGNTRKLTDIYKDLGDKLRTYNRADAFNLAKQAGISESTFNLIRSEAQERERILALGQQNAALDEQKAAAAAELQSDWREIGQEINAAGIEILTNITPPIKQALGWVKDLFGAFKETGGLSAVGKIFTGIWDVVRLIVNGWKEIFNLFSNSSIGKFIGRILSEGGKFGEAMLDRIHELAGGDLPAVGRPASTQPKGQANYAQTISSTEAQYGLPPGLLSKLIKTESNYDPSAFNKGSGATGIAQLLPKYFPNAGKDANADINTAGQYLRQLYAQFGDWTKAVAAYNDGPGNINKVLSGTKSLPDETAKYVNKIVGPGAAATFAANNAQGGAGAAGKGALTQVQIDSITVQTQATNAAGVAAELPGALKRKGVVAQADAGMS